MTESYVLVFFLVVLSAVLLLTFVLMSEKDFFSREKLSPYECGFDPILSARSSFSLRFFLIAVLFVVFDVEMSLLLPVVLGISYGSNYVGFLSVFIFVMILFFGIYHEWREGSLDWI